MKITCCGDILNITHIAELTTATANSFQSEVSAALPEQVRRIDLDLSQTGFVDCTGLGALIALRKRLHMKNANVTIRLLNPSRPLQKIVTLLGMNQIFSVETAPAKKAEPGPVRAVRCFAGGSC